MGRTAMLTRACEPAALCKPSMRREAALPFLGLDALFKIELNERARLARGNRLKRREIRAHVLR